MNWATAMSVFYFSFTIGLMTLIYGTLLYVLVSELAACFRRWRSASAAERMLDSVPDVPYLLLPVPDDQQQASSSCVICIAEYACGEGRFVLPCCGHAFHRGCITEWLRQGRTTCPVCRATAIVVVPAAGEEKVDAAAVSTAEDMV